MKNTFYRFKNTTLFIAVLLLSICFSTNAKAQQAIVIGANRTKAYLPLLKGKNIAVVANTTSVIFKKEDHSKGHTHLIDSLTTLGVKIKKVFAPEHGFRGTADAGEKVSDGKDLKTGIPIVSLYGKYRKPSPENLKNIDLIIYDIQDVGVRFYTYIATLQLVMQAAGEAKIPVLVLDRPNPNIHYVDGPTMNLSLTSFLGMTPIPLVYGMSVGEYATMINTEPGWLGTQQHPLLTVIEMENYTRAHTYSLPLRPSPNLPNDQSIALYPSLGLFEGTTINAGRGTKAQFTRYGAPELKGAVMRFTYTPIANFGAKSPKHKGTICYGENLSEVQAPNAVDLKWLIKAYQNSSNKDNFFISNSFAKHAGNNLLETQIKNHTPPREIYASWQKDIKTFKTIRAKYLRY